MAPQKRKTGGRVTAAGTRPGEAKAKGAGSAGSQASAATNEPGRYTAPIPKHLQESPKWVPIAMLAFFIIGGIAIMARYLWWDENLPMIIGMGCLLAGLFTATRWR